MKKIVFYTLAALALTACGSRKCDKGGDCAQTAKTDGDMYYEGVLPAADAAGIRYSLVIDYDDDNPAKGDYELTQTYLKDDGSPISSFYSEGDFDVKTGTPANSAARYLVMVPEVEDGAAPADTMYFLAETDSTLTLAGEDLSKSVNPGLNYTITRVTSLSR